MKTTKKLISYAGCVDESKRKTISLAELEELIEQYANDFDGLLECYNDYLESFDSSIIVPDWVKLVRRQFYEKIKALDELYSIKEDVFTVDVLDGVDPFSYTGMETLQGAVIYDEDDFVNGVKYVSPFSFALSSLEEVHIPFCCELIGAYAFAGTKLKEVDLASDNQGDRIVLQGAFQDCKYLKRVYGMSDLLIDDSVYEGCRSLKEIEVSENLTEIGSRSFKDCKSLMHFVFPESLESIGDEAFAGCSKLKTIRFMGCSLKLGDDVFSGCPLKEVYVPEDSLDLYKEILPDSLSAKIIVVRIIK